MTIYGRIEIEGFLSVCDIDNGDCFAFLDEDILYIKVSDVYYVDLKHGILYKEENGIDRPVRRINAEINLDNLQTK